MSNSMSSAPTMSNIDRLSNNDVTYIRLDEIPVGKLQADDIWILLPPSCKSNNDTAAFVVKKKEVLDMKSNIVGRINERLKVIMLKFAIQMNMTDRAGNPVGGFHQIGDRFCRDPTSIQLGQDLFTVMYGGFDESAGWARDIEERIMQKMNLKYNMTTHRAEHCKEKPKGCIERLVNARRAILLQTMKKQQQRNSHGYYIVRNHPNSNAQYKTSQLTGSKYKVQAVRRQTGIFFQQFHLAHTHMDENTGKNIVTYGVNNNFLPTMNGPRIVNGMVISGSTNFKESQAGSSQLLDRSNEHVPATIHANNSGGSTVSNLCATNISGTFIGKQFNTANNINKQNNNEHQNNYTEQLYLKNNDNNYGITNPPNLFQQNNQTNQTQQTFNTDDNSNNCNKNMAQGQYQYNKQHQLNNTSCNKELNQLESNNLEQGLYQFNNQQPFINNYTCNNDTDLDTTFASFDTTKRSNKSTNQNMANNTITESDITPAKRITHNNNSNETLAPKKTKNVTNDAIVALSEHEDCVDLVSIEDGKENERNKEVEKEILQQQLLETQQQLEMLKQQAAAANSRAASERRTLKKQVAANIEAKTKEQTESIQQRMNNQRIAKKV